VEVGCDALSLCHSLTRTLTSSISTVWFVSKDRVGRQDLQDVKHDESESNESIDRERFDSNPKYKGIFVFDPTTRV
jgi:hypothetical protein